MRTDLGRQALETISRYCAWFALTYLGYCAAVFLQSVLVPTVIYPVLGSPVEEWRLTAFRAVLFSGSPEVLPFSSRTRELIVLLAQALLLVWALRLSISSNRLLLRTWILQAALWTVLLRLLDSAFLAFSGRGSLAAFLPGITASRTGQIGAAIVLGSLLTPVGIAAARRLIALSTHFQLRAPSAWKGAALLILSVCLIMGGLLNFQLRGVGVRTWIYVAVPGAFCLLIAVLALTHRGRVALAASTVAPSQYGMYGALVPVLVAALAYGGLQSASQLERWKYTRELQVFSTPHYDLRYDPNAFSASFVREFAEGRERAFARLASRLMDTDSSVSRQKVDKIRIQVVLYNDFPRKRAATRSDRPYTVEGATVHALMHGYIQTLDPAADAAALLHETWGTASSLVIRDWVARLLAAEWRGETIEGMTARLQWEEAHYPLERLLDVGRDSFLSPLVREPLGASWIASLRAAHGVEAVRNLYSHAPENASLADVSRLLSAQPTRIESDWALWTSNLAANQAPISRPARTPDLDFFYRGMTFSHEGWGGRRGGYTGPEAEKQLRILAEMGVNSIAVVPYGFQQGATSTTISATGTDETDEELTQALFLAHRLGIKVMLKPHIWVGGGAFTGEIRFSEPAARAGWFHNYRAFLLHYARLAEQERFDMLCIGNELTGMAEHAVEWRKLVSEVRRVYRGPVTYAANWGQEFESVSFWDDLDYIGLNHYYPLHPAGDSAAGRPVQAADLITGAEKVAGVVESVSRKYGRSVIFTEIGYPSYHGGTAEPWVDDRRRGNAPEEQAAAYEACFRVYSNKPWLRGMFWWKWSSNGRGGGEQDGSFTPMRKPAAEVLRVWYERLAGGPRVNRPDAPKCCS